LRCTVAELQVVVPVLLLDLNRQNPRRIGRLIGVLVVKELGSSVPIESRTLASAGALVGVDSGTPLVSVAVVSEPLVSQT